MTRTFRSLGLVLAAIVLALAGMAVSNSGVSMAQTTITIPLTTFSVGSHTSSTAVMSPTTTNATLTIDRTAGNKSLNSQPATTTLTISLQVSFDGGATWPYKCDLTTPGGSVPDDFGNPETTSYETCTVYNEGSSNRMARAVVTVSGTQVSLSGSLTYS